MTAVRCWSGTPGTMGHPHAHDGVEVNLVSGGDLAYLVSGRYVVVPQGQLALIWSAVPHRLVEAAEDCRVRWVTVGLAGLHGWAGRDTVAARLMREVIVVVPQDAADEAVSARWESVHEGPQDVAGLEVQAAVHRWLSRAGDRDRTDTGPLDPGRAGRGSTEAGRPAGRTDVLPEGGLTHAAAIAEQIAAGLEGPLAVADLARAAGLAPGYAMTVFRQVTGLTIGAYIRQCRTARAHELLLTTELSVVRVGHAAGFGSASRFYAAFTELYGMPPAAFRRRHRGLLGGA